MSLKTRFSVSLQVFLLFCAVTAGVVGAPSAESPDGSSPIGIVIEKVDPGLALDRAGVTPGDILVSWRREAKAPTGSDSAEGFFPGPFDLYEVETEQPARGELWVVGTRNGETFEVVVPQGFWGVRAAPLLNPRFRRLYDDGLSTDPEEPGGENEAWRAAVDLALAEDNHSLAGWFLHEMARSLADNRQFERAGMIFEEAIEEGRRGADRSLEFAARRSLAAAVKRSGDLDRARDLFADVVERRRMDGPAESLRLAKVLDDLAVVEWRAGELDAADLHLNEALEICRREVPGTLPEAARLNDLGLVQWSRGDLGAAEELYRRSLEIKESIVPGSIDVAYSTINLGILAWKRGDLFAAERAFREANGIYDRLLPGSEALARGLNNLGLVQKARRDLVGAERSFFRAADLFEAGGSVCPDLAYVLTNLSALSSNRGDSEAAEAYARRSLGIKRQLGLGPLEMASSYALIGSVFLDRGALEEAEKWYSDGFELIREVAPESLEVAAHWSSLGTIEYRRGDVESAGRYFALSLKLIRKMAPGSLREASVLRKIAAVDRDLGNLRAAEEGLRRALELRRALALGSVEEAETSRQLGQVLVLQGRKEHALAVFEDGLAALSAQRLRWGGSQVTRVRLSARASGLFWDTIDLLVAMGRLEQAFEVLEASRAQALLETLGSRILALPDEIPEDLERERWNIQARHGKVTHRLSVLSENDEEAVQLRIELQEILLEQKDVAARIRAAAPRLSAFNEVVSLNLEGVQEALEDGTLFLEYLLGEDYGYLFSIGPGPGRFSVTKIEIGEEALVRDVRAFREVLERPGRRSTGRLLGLARSLGEHLLRPAAGQIEQAERIVIAPDGVLHLLPFAALSDTQDPSRFLIEVAPVTSVASGTVLAQLKRESPGAAGTRHLVAFGDPSYPSGRDDDEPVRAHLERSGLEFAPLPGTRLEVEAIAGLFGDSASVFLGSEATEERAREMASKAGYLHFACHAKVDERFPLESALVLSVPEDWHEGQDNGLLQAWEVLEGKRSDVELVTLSGCQTGLGQEMAGEGILGLTRAFQIAGARAVLATLWQVNDHSTSGLMWEFYSRLLEGESKDSALRQAQLAMIRGPVEIDGSSFDASHPYYWAPFVLSGNRDPGPRPPMEIDLGATVEVELVEGEVVTVRVEAPAGDVLRAVIDQRGVDVETTWIDVNGARLGRIDSFGGNEGLEVGSAVVPESGRLFLELRAGLSDSDGSVRLTVEGGAHREWVSNDSDFLAATLATEGASNEELLAAADRFFQIARTAGAIGDPLQQVCARLSAVSILNRLGEAERALEILENQEVTAASENGGWVEAKRLESLGIAYQRRREHRKALTPFVRAREIYRDNGYRRSEGYVLVRIRRCHLWLGELETAMEYAEQGLRIWETMGDTGWQASAMEDMGMLSSRLGRLDRALEIYEDSLPLWRESGNVRGEGETQFLIGKIFFKIGEFERALDHHRQALDLMQSIEDHHGTAQAFSSMADVNHALGNLQEAIEYNEKAVGETLAGNGTWEGLARIGMGRTLQAAGESKKARAQFERALVFFREERIRWAEGMSLALLGSLDADRGEHEPAMRAYSDALEIAEDLKDRPRMAEATELMAASLLATGRIDAATERYGAACELWRGLGDSGRVAGALLGLAAALEAGGDPAAAVPLIEESLGIRERTRSRMTGQDARATYVGEHRGGYEQLVNVLLELHRGNPEGGFLEKAFEISERARARGLVELLTESRIDVRRGIDPNLKVREQTIGARISSLQAGLIMVRSRGNAPKVRIEKIESELREAEKSRRELEIEIRRKAPRYANLRYPLPVTLDQTQNLLDEHSALLEYLVGRENSVLFVVLHDRVLSFRLPSSARLTALIGDFRRGVSSPGRRENRRWLRTASDLWTALLESAAPAIDGVDRLIVVPDGPLFSLPFEALVTRQEGAGEIDFSSLPYAGRRWIFTTVASAGVLADLKWETPSRPSNQSRTLVAFGDPKYPGGIAEKDSGRRSAGVEDLARGVLDRDDAWPLARLESSGIEVRTIAELFGVERSKVFLYESATEENAKNELEGARVDAVHFATHALVSSTEPERSGLVLTLDEDPREDGLLQVFEIFNMHFDTDLVVLSACETGLGKTVRGEGVLGLNRAFLYAGARSTVVSLWRVADDSTAELMEAFYRRIAAGDDRATALQQAKVQLISGGRFAHPFYWAPFILTGDPGAGSGEPKDRSGK